MKEYVCITFRYSYLHNLFKTLCITLLFINNASSQNNYHKNFTTIDNLPSNRIYCAAQDKSGIIWFGTDNGISKFDGKNFENLTVNDGLPDNDIWSIKVDDSNRVWLFGFNKPPCFYLNNRLHNIQNNPKLKSLFNFNSTFFVNVNRDFRKYYFQSIINNRFTIINFDDGIVFSTEKIKGLTPSISYVKKNGIDYILGTNFLINLQSKKLVKFDKYVLDQPGQFNFKNRDYFIANDYLFKKCRIFDIINDSIKLIKEIPNFNYKGPFIINKEMVFFVSEQGNTILLKNDNFLFTEFISGFQIKGFSTHEVDKNNGLWFTTANSGVFYFPASNVELISQNLDLETINLSQNGNNLIFSENKSLFSIYQNGHIKKIKIPIEFKSIDRLNQSETVGNLVYCVGNFDRFVFDFNTGKLVFNGLNVHNNPKFPLVSFGRDIEISNFYKNHLVISGNYGAGYLNAQDFSEKRLFTQKTISVCDTKYGELYFGTNTGLFYAKDNKSHAVKITISNKIDNARITDLKVDKIGRIWVATAQYGLCVLQKNRPIYFSETNKNNKTLISTFFKKLYIDKKNRVWAATDKGITIFLTIDNKIVEKQISGYNSLPEENIQNLQVNGDTVYVLGFKNVFRFIYNESYFFEKPTVYIKSMLANGFKLNYKDNIKLNPDENNVSLEFGAISFKFPDNIGYMYKINKNSNWISLPKPFIELPNLTHGEYQLQIKAINSLTGEESSVEKIRFIVLPHWYETWWFYSILAIIIGIAIFSFFKIRTRRLVKEAAKESEFNRKIAEVELQSLHGQMNPHFIFNALNSIQNLIFSKKEDLASKYLGKISTMFRDALEFTRNAEITLEQEVKFMQRYLEIEQMRFPNKFEFEITIQESILDELNNIKIPPLMMQPLAENSVKHGMKNLTTTGKINIDIKVNNDVLVYAIIDNGGGFAKQTSKTHISRGTQIIQQRIDILNQTFKTNLFSFKLINHENQGVEGVIILPLDF